MSIMSIHQSFTLRFLWLLAVLSLALGALLMTGCGSVSSPTGAVTGVPSTSSQSPNQHINWRRLTIPGTSSTLTSVTSTSTDNVWAVGASGPGVVTPDTHTLIEHWDGTTWRLVPSPDAETGAKAINTLNGIAAISASDAWAVGIASVDQNAPTSALIEHWDGKQWSIVKVSLPEQFQGAQTALRLNAVTALAPDDAWAVGGYNLTQQDPPTSLLLHWDGSKWNMVQGLPGVELKGINALNSRSIWAVGIQKGAKGSTGHAIVLYWDGTHWQVHQEGPSVADFTSFSSVSASSADDVWAVGTSGPTVTKENMFIGHWNGKMWSYMVSPALPGDVSEGKAIVARSAQDVWSIGVEFGVQGGPYEPSLKHWNGTTWTRVDVSSQILSADLNGIAVTSKAIWIVGGNYENGFVPVILSGQ